MAATKWEVKRGHQIQVKGSRCKGKMMDVEDTIGEHVVATIVVKDKETTTKEVAVVAVTTEAIIEVDRSREVVEHHT